MPQVRFSIEAENDLDQIAAYTLTTWGWRQTHQYLAQLEDCCDRLAANPSMGRACDDLRRGLQRFEIGRHVIFYVVEKTEILIVRVLHQHMIPANYIL